MTDERTRAIVSVVRAEALTFYDIVASDIDTYKQSSYDLLNDYKNITTLIIVKDEIVLVDSTVTLIHDAEFHTLRAYHHASPSLISILTAIYKFIVTVIEIIQVINTLVKIITEHDLAYWIDQMFPGFEQAWHDMMNKISEVSQMLGWGVDGACTLLKICNTGNHIWGSLSGNTTAWFSQKRMETLQFTLDSFSRYLDEWQQNPGSMFDWLINMTSERYFAYSTQSFKEWTQKLDTTFETGKSLLTDLGSINNDLLSFRNGMPQFIAQHIPSAIWDGLERSDSMINDRVLPAISSIHDKIDEIWNVVNLYQKKMTELSDKIAHPGDLMAEIDQLDDYVRIDQENKIATIANRKQARENDLLYQQHVESLDKFNDDYIIVTAPTPPSPALDLEISEHPGWVSPDVKLRQSWFVGDF